MDLAAIEAERARLHAAYIKDDRPASSARGIHHTALLSSDVERTIRFYQGRGLLAPPRRQGRLAVYDDSHRERLARIRELLDDGLTLALIKRVLDRGETPRSESRAAADTAPAGAARNFSNSS